ncbi:ankyrin [Colletotrichum zoysiae]|uniref:Ankyrin n=1 Tax=Colletotrichum zoysiae TaxID=1216348 RepID=A0AAD9HGX2_9PEZI|nr:ankyrin [Colletotrichum zoysiae]
MAQFLISYQADNEIRAANINLQNEFGETALHLAVRSGEVEMVHLLLRHGANTNIQDKRGDAAIHVALGESGCPTVQLLLKYDANLHLQNHAGDMAIHIASRIENISVLESLIQQGGDINAKDRHLNGMTALHYAAQKSYAVMVRRLLLLVPEQNKRLRLLSTQDRFGQTALHSAAKRDTLKTFRVLFEAGADLELCDRNGIKPIDYAADKISRQSSLERQLYLLGYRRILQHQNGRMVSRFTK